MTVHIPFVEHIYSAFSRQLAKLPDWLVSVGVLFIAIIVGVVLHRLLYAIFTRIAASHDLFWRSLVQRTRRPALFTLIIIAAYAGTQVAPLTTTQAAAVSHILLICFIGLLGWLAKTSLHIWTILYLRRFKLDAADNLLARKHVTQSRILLKVANLLIIVVTLAVAMMTFDEVRQYGISLLAAGGAAGIVVGLALQPILKNVFAGIQLAVTQPIRIDDALIVEGEWGRVEEITSTYVVLKIWDWRRLILPLSYFIEKPFQNWTRENASLIGTVMIYLDYSVPVAAIRAEAEKIAHASALWDRDVISVAVTDFREKTMEVRILVSAGDSGRAFDLRCE
ncbi:MAG TPA: mechanosensitive ion channel family protein, partial [Gammaproteobacteria bacterium]|nr:mechanosensitive ion channel family protein [Gammaproteobacteria bacterium]